MTDKKTGIAIVISVTVILLVFGGASFLQKIFSGQENNQQQAAVQQQDQLQAQDVTMGTGDIAVAGKQVTVNYTGVFTNGKKFDSSIDRGVPFTFTLGAGQVIKGWDIGIEGMKVGGKRILVVPPDLGYGANDYGPIPGNSTLIFYVELLSVK